jgi:hypothetical protein
MKVASNLPTFPNLYRDGQKTVLQSGLMSPRPKVPRDLLEISNEGRQLDVIAKVAKKVSIPQSPKDDVNEIMQMVKPETYERMKGYLDQGNAKEGLEVLLSFAKELGKHPEWIQAYRKAAQK